MPLEISEIGVRMAVGQGPAPSGPVSPPQQDSGGGEAMTPAHMEQIVQACVQEVMRSLRMREER